MLRGLLLATLLALPGGASADVFRTADLHLQAGSEPGSIELTARLPDTERNAGTLQWPRGCRQTESRQVDLAGRVLLVVRAVCTQAADRGAVIKAPWTLDGARLSLDRHGAVSSMTLVPGVEGIAIPLGAMQVEERGWLEMAPAMLWQGMVHIWFGWDHLAFVLCLCMLCRGWRLLGLVTAFTLGHSVSLGLAFFDVLRLPVAPVEALIALSIVLVAREAQLAPTAAPRSASTTRAALMVVIFGLVHGLGFASALGELGIAPTERWPALVFFNLGVEIGQVLFVLGLLGLFAALRPPRLQLALRSAAPYAAGITGVFWLVERVAAFS